MRHSKSKKLFPTIPRSTRSINPGQTIEVLSPRNIKLNFQLDNHIKKVNSTPVTTDSEPELKKYVVNTNQNTENPSVQSPLVRNNGQNIFNLTNSKASNSSSQAKLKCTDLLLRQKSGVTQEKRSEILQKHKQIFKSKINEKKKRYDDKMWRFDIRNNRVQGSKVAKGWSVLILSALWSKSISKKFTYRKDLHFRSEKVLIRLTILMRVIGKFLRIKRKYRKNKALMTFRKLVNPAKKWVSLQKFKYTYAIVNTIDIHITQALMFKIMVQWNSKLIFIQRQLRSALRNAKVRNGFFRLMWNKTEVKMHREYLKRRKTNTTDYTPEASISGKSSIPDEIKDIYIKRKIKEKVIFNIQKLANYREQVTLAETEFNRTKHRTQAELFLQGKSEELKFIPPPRPFISYFISQKELRSMIIEASQSRKSWK